MSRMLASVLCAVLLAAAPLDRKPGFVTSALAQPAEDLSTPSNLPVPRFASIGSSRVRLRQGPSQDHRILWVFDHQQGLPVEVVAETEMWRQIRDPDGDLGWVHRALLSESRSVVIVGDLKPLRRRASAESAIIAYLEPRVVARLNQCDPEWCEISVQGFTGWVRHEDVWGVYPQEVVE